MIDILVNSAGGCFSSRFQEFVRRYAETNDLGNSDGLKHISYPVRSTDIKMAVHLYADPRDTVYYCHKRGSRFAADHSVAIGGRGLPLDWSIWDWLACDDPVEYLPIQKHFDNWYGYDDRRYPIVFIRYELLWDNLEHVLSMLGLSSHISEFPKKQDRDWSWRDLGTTARKRIDNLYGGHTDKINKLQPVIVLPQAR